MKTSSAYICPCSNKPASPSAFCTQPPPTSNLPRAPGNMPRHRQLRPLPAPQCRYSDCQTPLPPRPI
nr:MAG TPA: hypothetical protein [Caudoviricetes sp.]